MEKHTFCQCLMPFCKWCMNANLTCTKCGKEDDGEEEMGIYCDPPAKDFDDTETNPETETFPF